MAQFYRRFASHSQSHDKSQPRRLSRLEDGQPCTWTDCSVKATNMYKDKVYCPSHLFQILQQQWQK